MIKNRIDCVTVGDIQTNCWLYLIEDSSIEGTSEPRPCVVIDPGDEALLIISRLKDLNWVPRFIFFTHGHFDHLAALPELLEAFEKGIFGTSPLPAIGIHKQDAQYLGKNSLQIHRDSFIAAGGDPAYVDALWNPLPDAELLFEEGSIAGPFTVLHVPGHSPGSACFYDEKAGILFSGDTLFKGDWGRTDLPGGNEGQIRESLTRLLSLQGDTKVYPGHGPDTEIAHER